MDVYALTRYGPCFILAVYALYKLTSPRQCQRTVAREIAVGEVVGQGRYGLVKRGAYQGQPVAVKVFFSMEEASWQREKQVYQTCRLQHPNVLGKTLGLVEEEGFVDNR